MSSLYLLSTQGVAYVDMETDEDADKAIKSRDIVLCGEEIRDWIYIKEDINSDRTVQIYLSNPPKKAEPGLGNVQVSALSDNCN